MTILSGRETLKDAAGTQEHEQKESSADRSEGWYSNFPMLVQKHGGLIDRDCWASNQRRFTRQSYSKILASSSSRV